MFIADLKRNTHITTKLQQIQSLCVCVCVCVCVSFSAGEGGEARFHPFPNRVRDVLHVFRSIRCISESLM